MESFYYKPIPERPPANAPELNYMLYRSRSQHENRQPVLCTDSIGEKSKWNIGFHSRKGRASPVKRLGRPWPHVLRSMVRSQKAGAIQFLCSIRQGGKSATIRLFCWSSERNDWSDPSRYVNSRQLGRRTFLSLLGLRRANSGKLHRPEWGLSFRYRRFTRLKVQTAEDYPGGVGEAVLDDAYD